MRKNLFVVGLVFAVGLMLLPVFITTAREMSFAERFATAGPEVKGVTGTYKFDKAHSEISFSIRHFVSNVQGRFTDFAGTINYDAEDMKKSAVEFTAQATSIDTANAERDQHLRTADFFDVEKFPTLTFKSTKVEQNGKHWMVTGDLMIHGVTKQLTFPFELLGFSKRPSGEMSMGVEASTTINRKDFGIVWNRALDSGGTVLGDDVKVALNIEAALVRP